MSFGWLKGRGSTAAPSREIAKALPLPPKELAARVMQASAARTRGDLEQARSILEELNATNPGNAEVLTNLGVCHIELGDAELSREVLLAATAADPRNLFAYKRLSAVCLVMRDFGACLEAALYVIHHAPNDDEAHGLAGSAYVGLGNFVDGARHLNRSWELNPDSPVVLYRLECLSQDMEVRRELNDAHPGIAASRRRVINRMRAAYRKKKLDGNDLTYLIAILCGSQQDFPEAAKIALASISYEPMQPALAAQISRVLRFVGDDEKQLAFARTCFEMDPDNLGHKFTLGSSWISSGADQWFAGWRLMTETYYVGKPFVHPATVPIWEGQKPGKKKILVYQDQGLGDAILGFRFLRELVSRGISFDLWVHPDLADLAEQLPGPQRLIRGQRAPNPDPKEVSYAASFFGLISAMHLGIEEIKNPPVVRPKPEHARALRDRVAALPGVRVGLLFGGNPRRRDDWIRSLPISLVRGLAKIEGISWVNLMIDERPERDEAIAALGMLDPMPQVRSFCDTAAVVEELDAVVAVDASVAHLAANLEKPLWVLLPTMCDWRWQIGKQLSPWWPAARVLRSEAPGVWNKVVDVLVPELQQFVQARR